MVPIATHSLHFWGFGTATVALSMHQFILETAGTTSPSFFASWMADKTPGGACQQWWPWD